jgi:hypothetical protein
MKSAYVRTGVIAGCLVLALSAWGKKPPAAPPAPPPPPPPPTALSANIVQAAADYQAYIRQATGLQSTFADGAQVQSELQTGEAFGSAQLSRGAIAYAAVLALQDPTFVASVKKYAVSDDGRAAMIKLIAENPAYAGQLDGAQSAASLIVAKLTADGEALHTTGSNIKQAAYTMQHDKWSKDLVQDRDGRLALAKQLSLKDMTAGSDDNAQLLHAAVSGEGLNVTPATTTVQPPYTEGVIHGLAVAALAILGGAGDGQDTQAVALLDEQAGPKCLDLAKLNQYQCLAVSKPHYEDVFCLGQHVLMDTGRCVQRIVGTAPAEVLEVNPASIANWDAKKTVVHHKGTAPAHHRKRNA